MPAEAPRPTTASGVHSEAQAEEVLRHVNAEYARSKKGRWRRLFPAPNAAAYYEFLEPHQRLHRLPFDVS